MSGGIKEWPQDERPREKLLNQGAAGLTDAELLALIVRSGDPTTGRSAIDLGRELISHFLPIPYRAYRKPSVLA